MISVAKLFWKISSVQFSRSVMSDTFGTPWTAARQASLSITNSWSYSNSCPLSQWCHPTISSSVVPFSSHPQSFPALGSFLRNQFFTSGGQSIGVSASASILPMNIQDWSPLGWTGWISKGLSRAFSNTTGQKHQFFSTQLQNDRDGGGVGNGWEQVCCTWRSSLSFTELPWRWGRAILGALESHLNQVLMFLASGTSGTL